MKKLVIIPGGFHPFHAGHKALYDAARAAFPSAEIYVAATADTSTRPFPFPIKEKLARLAGIPAHRFIQVKSPFRAQEITQHFDPNDTQLIFVRSEKDRDQQPMPGGTKKDGSLSYLQPYKRNGMQPMSQHGYIAYLPVVQFGNGMTSATEIRAKWPQLTPEQKANLVNSLYPQTANNNKLTDVTIKLLDAGMGDNQVQEALRGAPIGGAIPTKTVPMPNRADKEVDEATLVNDPEQGELIRPNGGLGTWSENTLVTSLAKQLSELAQMIKSGNYSGAEHLLYNNGAVKAKVQALARLQDFKTKQGRKPIARGREIEIGENTDYVDETK
jgi:glycerol-3-phosphate cytidylyltransferase-like family protein